MPIKIKALKHYVNEILGGFSAHAYLGKLQFWVVKLPETSLTLELEFLFFLCQPLVCQSISSDINKISHITEC